MSRQVLVVDQSLDVYFKQAIAKHVRFAVGLVVGQAVDGKTYAYGHIPTNLENAQSWGKETAAALQQHALLVQRMLVGGLSVIGCFVISGDWGSIEPKLGGILRKFPRMVETGSGSAGRFVVHCPLSNRCTCYSVQSNGPQAGKIRAATLKSQDTLSALHSFQADYTVDMAIALNLQRGQGEGEARRIEKQILQALTPQYDSIQSALARVAVSEGESTYLTHSASLTLDKAFGGDTGATRGKKGKRRGGGYQEHCVSFFTPLSCLDTSSSSPRSMTVRGILHARACLHGKYTVADALDMLKADLIDTLRTRFECLFAEAEDNETVLFSDNANGQGTQGRVVYQLPRRVMVKWPFVEEEHNGEPLPALLSDYVFADEAESDSIERVVDALGLQTDQATALAERGLLLCENFGQDALSLASSSLPSPSPPSSSSSSAPSSSSSSSSSASASSSAPSSSCSSTSTSTSTSTPTSTSASSTSTSSAGTASATNAQLIGVVVVGLAITVAFVVMFLSDQSQ